MLIPTEEQQAIIDAAKGTGDNLIVNALAGAAKTSSLEMVCRAITNIPILSLAFNKKIADEMTKRLPLHVETRTLNSLGHRTWNKTIGRNCMVSPRKMADFLKTAIGNLPAHARGEAWADHSDTLEWLRRAKRDGWVPKKYQTLATSLSDLDGYGEEPTELQWDLIHTVMGMSIDAAYAGNLDFDDQIYMPVLFKGSFPKFPLILVDEMQDLNELQHAMLDRLVARRVIGVGDPWQSIYAFRGAKQGGMSDAATRWAMSPFTLSTTFRVPQSGVRRAWSRVPHMRWRPGAPEGRVESLEHWTINSIPDGAAVLCRNNAPLFTFALRALRAGRRVQMVGMDIGPGLIRIMQNLGPANLTVEQCYDAIDNWAEAELKKGKNEDNIYERVECLRTLCVSPSLGDSIVVAQEIFRQDGPVQLMSGHKAKGLEWDTVYHLDPWRVPSKRAREDTEEYEQELNIKYVIETRFKENLFLINMEDMG